MITPAATELFRESRVPSMGIEIRNKYGECPYFSAVDFD
jgi:hypothetical protein